MNAQVSEIIENVIENLLLFTEKPSESDTYNTIPFLYPNALLQQPCQCVGAWYGMRVYVRVTKGGLIACVCLLGVNARMGLYNNGGLIVG